MLPAGIVMMMVKNNNNTFKTCTLVEKEMKTNTEREEGGHQNIQQQRKLKNVGTNQISKTTFKLSKMSQS
jgi:hypothetical protein